MLGIRQKLSLGFGGLMLIIAVIGTQSIIQLSRLGGAIDVILRENYRSVIACQEMKESLERIDSGCLFTLIGDSEEGQSLITANEAAFLEALSAEEKNITLPGEGEKAALIRTLFTDYQKALSPLLEAQAALPLRRDTYFETLLPLFGKIKNTADDILQTNQQNMSEANDRARRTAAQSKRAMYVLLLTGALIAAGFIIFTGRWILRPIRRLIRSADEIRRGNLDLVVRRDSRDEIGQLSESFNDMALALRDFRRSDQARIGRIRQATQRAFDNLPEAVAVVDPAGIVELATESARNLFGLLPDTSLARSSFSWMTDLHREAMKNGRAGKTKNAGGDVQMFVGGDERYYRPEAVPILDRDKTPLGVILTIRDVTQLRQQDELKKSVISTVSHQLKTPLSSVRMALHLLLEERIGPLTEKQVEILVAARDDSDRLSAILTNLLDLSRMEAGKAAPDLKAISPSALILDGIEPFRRASQGRGIQLTVSVSPDLPDVWADPIRIHHVFENLISNALSHTRAGGRIILSAEAGDTAVRFSIEDTGRGIPAVFLPRIFEPFFRIPGPDQETGTGLGLAIVKEIVEAQGGTVGVESREGKGATFTFSLRKADHSTEDRVKP